MIIVLLGYMASGKSTIGHIIARKMDSRFIDLDSYIEQKEELLIKDIFEAKGEIYFRKKEALYLKELMNAQGDLVLSLGGGTPCYGTNMQEILNNKQVRSVYLKASIPTIIDRLKNEQANRPLVAHMTSNEDLEEFIGKHLFERSQFYNQAHIVITTDGKTTPEISEDLIARLS